MKEKIIDIIKKSITEINLQLESDKQIVASEEAILFGNGGKLDSMDFVNLVCIIEDNIFNQIGKQIVIVSEKAFSAKYNPFKDINRLSEYIVELLESEAV